METLGIGDWPAKFRKVSSSLSNHCCRQSVCRTVVVVAMRISSTKCRQSLDSGRCGRVQQPNWAAVRLEMPAKLAKGRQDHELSRPRDDRFVLQGPGVLMRDVDSIQPDLHRRIDVAARTVADHPAVSFYNLVLVNQAAVCFR